MVCPSPTQQVFWPTRPSILWDCWSQIWPFNPDFPPAASYNALTRLIVLVAAAVAIVERHWWPLLYGLGAILVVVVVWTCIESPQYKQEYYQDYLPPGSQSSPVVQQRRHQPETTVEPDNPYGNPHSYNHCVAVNQAPLRDLPPIHGDQFVDKMYTGSVIVPPGLNWNRVPDTTLMARRPYPLTSLDAVTKPVGGWGSSHAVALR